MKDCKEENKTIQGLPLYCTMLAIMLTLLWIYQSSFNRYWQQTYQTQSVVEQIDLGSKESLKVKTLFDKLFQFLMVKNQVHSFPKKTIDPVTSKQTSSLKKNSEILLVNTNTEIKNTTINEHHLNDTKVQKEDKIILQKGDKVLFVGDSLMQGIAPIMQRNLLKHYGIRSENISKQGSGLIGGYLYEDLKQHLERYQYHTMVIEIGLNDFGKISVYKDKKKKYYKFGTQEWTLYYQERIEEIIVLAQKHNVKVIWLGLPYTKSRAHGKVYDNKIRFLDTFIEYVLNKRVFYLPIKSTLTDKDAFQQYLKINDKNYLVRSKDGLHFSRKGYKLVANQVMKVFQYKLEKPVKE